MLETLGRWDGALLLWVQEALRVPALNIFFSAFTQLGSFGLAWIILSALLLLHPRTRKAGVWALAALLLGALCTNLVLKHLVGRTRPWLMVEGLVPLVGEADPNSFPSGHTCAAFAAGGVWAGCTKKRWLKLLSIGQAVLMGFSRIYVGVHYPSDVLAGAAVGLFCAWAVGRLRLALEKRRGGDRL